MMNQVTAVEPNNENNKHPDQAVEPGDPRGSPSPDAGFTYASGGNPLSGFTIKRGLGHGGFGEVYYATSDAGKEVALKLIRRNLDVELRGIRQCLNLKHPHLLAIHDIRKDTRGDHWVIMEFVGDGNLEDAVVAHPIGMPTADALTWIHGIGAGVGYLHDHGVVHRDLKPGNIFSDEGVVKVGDYGLSKFISCSRRSGQTESVGTVHYMAPEVANGRYGKEIDIYALGVILYEMLTGRVPFEGESVGEVLMKHLTATPDVSGLAEPYRSVVARALEKDPTKRFSSVPAMLAELPQPAGPAVQVLPAFETPSRATAAAAGDADTGAATGGAGAGTSPFATAPAAEESFCYSFGRSIREIWHGTHPHAPLILMTVAVVLMLSIAGRGVRASFWFMIILGGSVYLIARALHFLKRSAQEPPSTPSPGHHAGGRESPEVAAVNTSQDATVTPPQARAGHPVRAARRWKPPEKPEEALVFKPPRERLAEFLGSLLGSTLVVCVMCLVMILFNGLRGESMVVPRPEQIAWLVLVSVAGAWAVLIPSKFWEGVRGDAVLRRFIMMVAGLIVGAAAFGTACLLQVHLPYDAEIPTTQIVAWPPSFYQDGTPLLLAHMACFGTLFLGVRWWRLADPLRTARLSLRSLVFCTAIAWLVGSLWHYPQPWLMMVACITAVAIQLSAPWVNPCRRKNHES